jgi:hypothetical protein
VYLASACNKARIWFVMIVITVRVKPSKCRTREMFSVSWSDCVIFALFHVASCRLV